MNTGTPKTTATELLNEFIALAQSRGSIDELTARRYEKKVCHGRVIETDPATAYMLLGIIAATQFDIEKSRENHANSIRLSDNTETRSNFSDSLGYLGFRAESAEQQILASEHSPEDLTELHIAIEKCAAAGLLSKAITLCAQYQQRGRLIDAAIIENQQLVLQRREITEETYQASISVANQILRENKQRYFVSTQISDLSSEEESIFTIIELATTLDEVMNLQDKMAVLMADTLQEKWYPEVIMFEYRVKK